MNQQQELGRIIFISFMQILKPKKDCIRNDQVSSYYPKDMKFYCVAGLLISLLSFESRAETITFFSPEIPGLIVRHDNGKLINKAAIVFIHLVSSLAGVDDDYEIVPLARAIDSTEHSAHTCALGIVRTKENETKFKWVGPIVRQKILLYANANDKRVIKNIGDARGLVIGVGRKTAAADKLREGGFLIVENSNEAINLKMLLAHHIDLWAANAIPAMAAMKEVGTAEPRLVTTIGTADGYIVCNRQVDDATIQRLNDAVLFLKKRNEFPREGT